MTRRFVLILLLISLTGVVRADDTSLSVLTYQFKHKHAEKAAGAIKTLVSAEGTVAIQPATNSIVITDREANLKAISAALQKFDTPPQPVEATVRLVRASRSEKGSAVPEAIGDVSAKLAMFRYNTYEILGLVNVTGREGEPGIVELGGGYRADFRFGEYDPASDSIALADFKLAKLQDDELRQVYKTTLNVKVGQTLVFGATRDPENRALLVIVSVKR